MNLWLDDTLSWWLPSAAAASRQAQGWHGERVHFHSTSPERHWVVRVDHAVTVTMQPSSGAVDVSVAGRASDLLLVVMNRLGPESPGLDATGNVDLFRRWAATIRYGTPAGTGRA